MDMSRRPTFEQHPPKIRPTVKPQLNSAGNRPENSPGQAASNFAPAIPIARGMVRRALGYKPGLEFCRDGAALMIFFGPGVMPLPGGGGMGSRRRVMLFCE